MLFGWRRKLSQFLLGTISFPAIDLPLTTNGEDNIEKDNRRFRLWGLTLGMTRDIIQLADQPNLPFISFVTSAPSYSKKDIGWSIQFVTSLTIFWKKYITKTFYTPIKRYIYYIIYIYIYIYIYMYSKITCICFITFYLYL
ncbi:hypothetical protein BJ944DRAFT_90764 [Cunninghamella echinulata]|nr:hypothetical protein BJ944DRAFT_90764 [Cunninghamella echinulata]